MKELYELDENVLGLIADGTYIYCLKSANNKIQKELYSGQKKRALIKPFVICTTNDYIVDVFGLFKATHNDASIMLQIMETNMNNIRSVFKEKDVIFLDRGFRDALNELQKVYKLNTKSPTCNYVFNSII